MTSPLETVGAKKELELDGRRVYVRRWRAVAGDPPVASGFFHYDAWEPWGREPLQRGLGVLAEKVDGRVRWWKKLVPGVLAETAIRTAFPDAELEVIYLEAEGQRRSRRADGPPEPYRFRERAVA